MEITQPTHSMWSICDPNAIYNLVELLGEGSYGCVYKGETLNSQEEYAIKILPCESPDDVDGLTAEIEFLKRLSSPYVVAYVDSFLYDSELWIIMEYCGGGSMADLFDIRGCPLEEECLRAVVAYSCLGLNHLHSQLTIHRDVKAGNILLTLDGKAKLADFGVSVQLTHLNQKRRTVIGTPYWMAPEVIQEISYDSKADIWSLGISILEMCEGQPPHFDVHPMRAIFMIPMKPAPRLADPNRWSVEMVDFISLTIVKKSEERASSEELLEHPWIRSDVESARGLSGCVCLRDLVQVNWGAIKSSRIGRRMSLNKGSLIHNGRLRNEALRNRVKAKLNGTKLSRDSELLNRPPPSPGHVEMLKRESSRVGSGELQRWNSNQSGTMIMTNLSGTLHNLPIKQLSNDTGTMVRVDTQYSIPDSRTNTLERGRGPRPLSLAERYLASIATTSNSPASQSPTRGMSPEIPMRERSGSRQSVRMPPEPPTLARTASSKSALMRGSSRDSAAESCALLLSSDDIVDFKNRDINTIVDPSEVYKFKQLLGEGSFGLVYRGELMQSDEEVAIKVLPCSNQYDIGSEVEFLRKFECPHVVSFQQAFVFNKELWIVMEYCAGGSVGDIMHYGKLTLDEYQLVGVVASCILGLKYIHSLLCVHRDIKAGNILLTADGKVKLADFGISVQLTPDVKYRRTLIGTPYWMAPEVIQENDYDCVVDIWSLGITILEMCEGQPPHFDLHPMRAVFLIPMAESPTLFEPLKWSSGLKDFLSKCLVKEPKDRASAVVLQRHEWIQHVTSLIELDIGLAKLRELVSNNLQILESYRSKRNLNKSKLLPMDEPAVAAAAVGYVPFQRSAVMMKKHDAKSVKSPTAPKIRKRFSFAGETDEDEEEESAEEESAEEGSVCTSSVQPSHYAWMRTHGYECSDAKFEEELVVDSASCFPAMGRNKLPLMPQLQSLLSSALTNRDKRKGSTSPQPPSFASKLPRTAAPNYTLLHDVLLTMDSQEVDTSTGSVSFMNPSLDREANRLINYEREFVAINNAYELEKSKIGFVRENAFDGIIGSVSDSRLDMSQLLEALHALPQHDKSIAPLREQQSYFRILKYFRKHWKAHLMSDDLKAIARDYHNIASLDEVVALELKTQVRSNMDAQCKTDLDALAQAYGDLAI